MKCFFLFAFLGHLSLFAYPQGFQLVEGEASSSMRRENLFVVQCGAYAVVNWDQFSIASGETVYFNQMNGASTIWNLVTGSGETQIDGSLLSNGMVVLINPNGIVIGPDADIQTSGFITAMFEKDVPIWRRRASQSSGQGVPFSDFNFPFLNGFNTLHLIGN